MAYEVDGKTIEHDREGYITDVREWSEALAIKLAEDEGIELTEEHWEVVNFLRDYYKKFQAAPAIRVLVRGMKKSMGAEKGNNKYLYRLFPFGPAKQACKIAGLPKPTGCI